MEHFSNKTDIIVVGGGHAGCEATNAAAKLGSQVLLITMNLDTIGKMSCNPAVGGVAKGQIVREIDALGGLAGIVADSSAIQFRMLNRSKGAAMWSPRSQNDRLVFSRNYRYLLEQNPNISFFQDSVESLIFEGSKLVGLKTKMGYSFFAKAIVLTTGTFMGGLIHIGNKQFGGGRLGEAASDHISKQLFEVGFKGGRMKTGTPPRIDGRTIDYDKTEIQLGDNTSLQFSYYQQRQKLKQLPCHITYTNNTVHDIIANHFEESPLFNGAIKGVGPRYCPSIEDKVNRFPNKDRHQIFIEPEGLHTTEVYLNGFSSSLSLEVQAEALKEIKGLENAKILKPGYAIEYDYLFPTQLNSSLQTKLIPNLFFAGQINGTTGYEEAACQGLVAGINAHFHLIQKEQLVLKRNEAYIGVLINDLISKGTEEPYRMFTSRSEYRLSLRQDNADIRLSPIGYHIGLLGEDKYIQFQKRLDSISTLHNIIDKTSINPKEINTLLESKNTSLISQKTKIHEILKRPQIKLHDLNQFIPTSQYEENTLLSVEIGIKYEGYISRELEHASKFDKLDKIKLPKNIDYHKFASISNEGKEKLIQHRPNNLYEASQISGISQSDISVLLLSFS